MKEYNYILETYKGLNTRYVCPICQKRNKTFSLYIDTKTGEHIHPTVGRCNRESNCGYHYTPKQYFQDNNISFNKPKFKAFKPQPIAPKPKPVSLIPVEIFKASLNPTAYEANHFVQFLIYLFGVEVTSQLVSRYFIATSKYWNGATVFWQIDKQGDVRTGKIMLYSPTTGKRIKVPFNHIGWVHKTLKQSEFELKQCLFGEHLLSDKTKPVAIVESEKTAVIASVYLPQFIWVAVGSLTNLNAEKCNILKGRNITLFPDLNGFEKWTSKANGLSHLATFSVSDLLERKATETEKKQGLDIADYLIKFNYKEFAKPDTIEQTPSVQPMVEMKSFEQSDPYYYLSKSEPPINNFWEQDIAELENYFKDSLQQNQTIKLNSYSTITDYPLFIKSHFGTIKANKNKSVFIPHLNRLQELKQVLTIKLN